MKAQCFDLSRALPRVGNTLLSKLYVGLDQVVSDSLIRLTNHMIQSIAPMDASKL